MALALTLTSLMFINFIIAAFRWFLILKLVDLSASSRAGLSGGNQ